MTLVNGLSFEIKSNIKKGKNTSCVGWAFKIRRKLMDLITKIQNKKGNETYLRRLGL